FRIQYFKELPAASNATIDSNCLPYHYPRSSEQDCKGKTKFYFNKIKFLILYSNFALFIKLNELLSG
ncbi:hypothetical protein, partial [Cecembia sp.]|uniref:hypothetical protein n=1 Tax=Cecembia sp. TaxID=1898110 RepID=UPI0025BC85AC